MKIKPVIMAGGSGTRLWPMSRQLYPKQFIKMFDGLSLLQKTLIRNKTFGKASVIICADHRFVAAEQIREINIDADLILEPMQRNTAPCAILGALLALEEGYDKVLLVPADHYISDDVAYEALIQKSCMYVEKYGIATIGIHPNFAHTGFGYIKCNIKLEETVYEAEKFVEKPTTEKAEDYLKEGNYFWNSGIFIYETASIIEHAKARQPLLFEQTHQSFMESTKDLDFIRLAEEPYVAMESISIDYAIMEHIECMALLKANFIWSDLGSWDSLWSISDKDTHNNHFEGDVLAKDVTNAYVHSPHKLTAVIGLSNIIIVNTDDAVLIADKSRSEEVKYIVNQLSASHRKEATEHTKTFRPWGYYQTIDSGDLHKVKRIMVHPGQKLSLQYHHHRAEHWVVVRGIAEIAIGDKIKRLSENDSIYIPKGMKHRLTNIGEIDLHLIEVQTGHYLGEDDIIRLNDVYGRQ